MTLALVYSRASAGIKAPQVIVEAHISGGLPGLSIVGLPEAAVRESKDRVRSALINSHFEFPSRRITINLAPADLPKEGGRFDLPIALGILAAAQEIPLEIFSQYEFVGELALSGTLRPISSTLPVALAARSEGRALIVPEENAKEAALPNDNVVFPAKNLLEVFEHLTQKNALKPFQNQDIIIFKECGGLDLEDVKGQAFAKRALEIAAAGGHSLLMIGPPGTGKTMLASRLPTIMPELSLDETLEVVAIHSLLAHHPPIHWGQRPFRAPHHTSSSVALVGGGSIPKPGEISLAHHGVLFLDELPEFDRRVLEVLREPLESASILISRANRKVEFPAKFQLVAAMNPCPCGFLGSKKTCRCTEEQIQRYRHRLSGPLLDRIDMHIEVSPPLPKYFSKETEEKSSVIKERIKQAYLLQKERDNVQNARLANEALLKHCQLDPKTNQLLLDLSEKYSLSARTYHRILRVARTIADLEKSAAIKENHVLEAFSYRKLDRERLS